MALTFSVGKQLLEYHLCAHSVGLSDNR
jgi:hypothetical protein